MAPIAMAGIVGMNSPLAAVFLAIGALFLTLGALRQLQGRARIQGRIWLLVGAIFSAVAAWLWQANGAG